MNTPRCCQLRTDRGYGVSSLVAPSRSCSRAPTERRGSAGVRIRLRPCLVRRANSSYVAQDLESGLEA